MRVSVTTAAGDWVLDLDEQAHTATVVSFTERPGGSLYRKAAGWLTAEASLLTRGPLADADYEARVAVCRQCEHLDAAPDPQIGFCKACGCAKHPRAELTVKGRMPAATCPKGKWSPTP
jgi:hypothetical protein